MATGKRKSESAAASITELQFQEALREYSANDIYLTALGAELDEEIQVIREQYEADIELLTKKNDLLFATIKGYCLANKDSLLPGKTRSFDTMYGVLGFRRSTPSLKLAKGVKWEQVVERLKEQGLVDYVRTVEEPNKEKLLSDRETEAVAGKLAGLGVSVSQEDKFFIELKKEVA